jgi:hypothetical protein
MFSFGTSPRYLLYKYTTKFKRSHSSTCKACPTMVGLKVSALCSRIPMRPNVDTDHVLKKPDVDFCHQITCGKTQRRDSGIVGFGLMFMTCIKPTQQITLSLSTHHRCRLPATALSHCHCQNAAVSVMRSPGRSNLNSVGADRSNNSS